MGRVLEGRVAVVVGATGWLGSAISHALAAAGASIVLVARDRDRLDALQRELGAGERVLAAVADVTSALEIDDARAAALDRFDRVDLVVVTSGIIAGPRFADAIPAEWADMIDVNLRGLLHAAQTFTPALLASADAGRPADLVLLGSVTAGDHGGDFAVFNSLSAAIKQLGRALRDEFGPRGVRVHVVEPGFPHVDDASGGRHASPIQPDSVAAVVTLAAALPRGANLAESVLLPAGRA